MGKVRDITGKRFGRLTVVRLLPKDEWKTKSAAWLCLCDCGNMCKVPSGSLISGLTKSCGCLHSESARKQGIKSRKNLIGKKYGMLTVISDAPKRYGEKGIKYICQCDCGNISFIRSDCLLSGRTKSCGCLSKKISRELMRNSDIYRKKPFDLTGKKFNMLTALYIDTEKQSTYWVCKCDCGRTCSVNYSNLKNGHTKSCGCISGFTAQRKQLFFDITGKISPNTHRVIFLDNNPKNITPENMISISKPVYNMMSNNYLFSTDQELTKSAILACELSCAVNSAEKRLQKRGEV